jgi:ribonuclease HII
MRRALASLTTDPEYVLTDGFPVDGLGVPGLAVWKGDRVAACVAAASVLAKVTRDRLMVELDGRFPDYGFAEHKGYCTDEHSAALSRHGPCIEHRFSYVNVAAVSGRGNRPPRARRPRAVIVPPSSAATDSSADEALMLWSVAEGTVGVASGEQPQPPTPVVEDGSMEGETR